MSPVTASEDYRVPEEAVLMETGGEEPKVAEEVKDVEIRPYRFEVVVNASSLDDALKALRLAGFDVDDLTKVKWLD